MNTITARTRSVYKDDPAGEFIDWLTRLYDGLSTSERASAVIDARPIADDGTMIGLRWTDDKT